MYRLVSALQSSILNAVSVILTVTMLSLTGGCGGGSSTPTPPTVAVDPTQPTTDSSPPDSEVVVDVDEDGNTTINTSTLDTALADMALGEISEAELTGLLLMREEEKLAGDVYLALFDLHGLNIFSNIANSEQTHTDAMLVLLERYDIADPVGTNTAGVFTDQDLQVLYDTLVAAGTPSLMDALLVGAKIEELDIADIERLKSEVENNDDIVLVYDNLLMGSRNHLRAFDRQITNNGWTYEPEYISQEQYDDIVNSDTERGPND